jgi:hypothetical protein
VPWSQYQQRPQSQSISQVTGPDPPAVQVELVQSASVTPPARRFSVTAHWDTHFKVSALSL